MLVDPTGHLLLQRRMWKPDVQVMARACSRHSQFRNDAMPRCSFPLHLPSVAHASEMQQHLTSCKDHVLLQARAMNDPLPSMAFAFWPPASRSRSGNSNLKLTTCLRTHCRGTVQQRHDESYWQRGVFGLDALIGGSRQGSRGKKQPEDGNL